MTGEVHAVDLGMQLACVGLFKDGDRLLDSGDLCWAIVCMWVGRLRLFNVGEVLRLSFLSVPPSSRF